MFEYLEGGGIRGYKIEDFKSYMGAFYTLVMATANRHTLKPEDMKRTISIDFE